VVILTIMLGFALLTLFQLRDASVANRDRVDLASEGDFVMQKIAWTLAGAESVADPAAGATSSQLSVQKYNFAQNPLVLSLASGTLYLARGSGPALALTSDNVIVDSLVFTHGAEVIAAPEFVQVALQLSAASEPPAVGVSTTMSTTIYLHQ
jgi:hypothetical protein